MTISRLRVVRKMYALRFQEDAPERRSVDQLRGIEGARVRETYRLLAQRHGVTLGREAIRSAGVVISRCGEPLPVGGDFGIVWCDGGGCAGRRLCAGDRLPAHWQAAELRLRHRGHSEVRDGCARGVSGWRRRCSRTSRWTVGR